MGERPALVAAVGDLGVVGRHVGQGDAPVVEASLGRGLRVGAVVAVGVHAVLPRPRVGEGAIFVALGPKFIRLLFKDRSTADPKTCDGAQNFWPKNEMDCYVIAFLCSKTQYQGNPDCIQLDRIEAVQLLSNRRFLITIIDQGCQSGMVYNLEQAARNKFNCSANKIPLIDKVDILFEQVAFLAFVDDVETKVCHGARFKVTHDEVRTLWGHVVFAASVGCKSNHYPKSVRSKGRVRYYCTEAKKRARNYP